MLLVALIAERCFTASMTPIECLAALIADACSVVKDDPPGVAATIDRDEALVALAGQDRRRQALACLMERDEVPARVALIAGIADIADDVASVILRYARA